MGIPIYVVDAFTSVRFQGNPAGVCLLESPADPDWMQSVAAEMRHAETAFLVPVEQDYDLRWFTPTIEVDLCGHATLASAHVLYTTGRASGDSPIKFHTRSGRLVAKSIEESIQLDFPADPPSEVDLAASLDLTGILWQGRSSMDWFVHLNSADAVRGYVPNLSAIRNLGMRGLILTAKSDDPRYDFISRFFAPQSGVDEDPVTGSAHTALGPYWSPKLGKLSMKAYQASHRGGEMNVEILGDRVLLTGNAVTVLSGMLETIS